MNKTTDFLFRVSLILKGVDSLFEVLGGILLTMPTRVARYLLVLSGHELLRHHVVMSGNLSHLAEVVQQGVSLEKAGYLFVHGLAKVILISAIFMNKRWGYTGLIVVLSIFSAIELIRAVAAHEIVTGGLAIFDIAVVLLIAKEYRTRFVTSIEHA